MDEILGKHIELAVFENYLANWESILAERVPQTTDILGTIDGVEGLILSGSNGRGAAWPLSDIDLIPVYANNRYPAVMDEVDAARIRLLHDWSAAGWRTGVDIGRLHFTVNELETLFASDDPAPHALLGDDRWYYSIDKAYQSRVLLDTHGLAERLSTWFTRHRFDADVVSYRLNRTRREALASIDLAELCLAENNTIGALMALLKSVQWFQIHLMEQWGERDNSLGRFGTRLERAAAVHRGSSTVAVLNEISDLSPELVLTRLEHAPWWVAERRDRSWRARCAIGEDVSALQNDRDVLRVSTTYELRVVGNPPYADWLAVPTADIMTDRLGRLRSLIHEHRHL